MIKLDRQRMDSLQSKEGGYTKALTSALGVPWPLVKGWKSDIIFSNREVTEDAYSELLRLKDIKCPKKRRTKN